MRQELAVVDLAAATVTLDRLKLIQEETWFVGMILAGAGLMLLPIAFLEGPAIGLAACLAYLATWVGLLRRMGIARRCQFEVEDNLVLAEDPRAAGLLFMSLESASGPRRAALMGSIIRMLTRLGESDSRFVSSEQHAEMRRALLRSENLGLSLAILKALEEIGSRWDRGLVRMLAEGLMTHTRDPRIQEAARKCLPLMNERLARQRDSEELLRPAGRGDALLRPRPLAESVLADSLLRPAGAD